MIERTMKKLPTHLVIVSCAFLFIGLMALLQTLNSLFNSPRPTIDFFIIFILIGYGLLRRNDLARSFAIACSMVTLIFQVAAVVLILIGKRVAGVETGQAIIFWVYTALTIAASGYALWALQSSAVRNLFLKR